MVEGQVNSSKYVEPLVECKKGVNSADRAFEVRFTGLESTLCGVPTVTNKRMEQVENLDILKQLTKVIYFLADKISCFAS